MPTAAAAVRLIKLICGHGATIFVAGLVLMVAPMPALWVVVALTIVNGGFLLASIAFSARVSLR